jgi:phage-related protein
MIRGAINGVLSAVGGLVDAARNAASRAVAGFKSALGISSPSKLMRDQVGVPIIQGVILGIDNMRANLRATLGDLALNAIVSPITSQPSFAAVASGAVASGASVVNNTNVTVNAPAPVVDADSIARLTTKRVVSALNTNTSGASR